MSATQPSFLSHRSRSFHLLSAAYLLLEALVKKLDLTPISGDVAPLTQLSSLGLTGEPTYWPAPSNGNDAGVIELRKGDQMLVRLTVCSDGHYYGCNRFGEGNHDWSIGELEQLITRTLQREETEHAGVRDSQGDLGQDAGEE